MITLIIILGLLTLGVVFAPLFIVSVAKLTIIAVVCYVLTSMFSKYRETTYLVLVLYVVAVLTMATQAIGPKIDSIEQKIEKLERITDRAGNIMR